MRILYAGHQATEQMAEDRSKGVKPGHRKGLSEFDNKLQSGEFDSGPTDPKRSAGNTNNPSAGF